MNFQEENHCYNRQMFFQELSQSIDKPSGILFWFTQKYIDFSHYERNKLSTNILFSNYLSDFKDIVQHNGLNIEEMNIICQLLCTVDLSVNNFKQILLTLVPEEPLIPSDICEELIVFALSIYRQNKDETKARCIFYWLLYVIEEKLTNLDVIDKYYKILFHLCLYGSVNPPIAGIIYNLTKPNDIQNWMVSCCKMNVIRYQPFMDKLITFFESPNLLHQTRQKGQFDSNTKYCKELACGLRSVRKELMNIHPQSTHSQQLIEYGKRSNIQFVNIKYKFEFPSAKVLAKEFMEQNISNSLSLLSSISGWCKLLMYTNAELNLQHRFSNNLWNHLDQMFLSNEINSTYSKKMKVLQEILEFQKFARRGLTVVNMFIFEYILSWDGIEFGRLIYELFEYLSFTSEEELKDRFLEKLYAIFISGDELIHRVIINSLTNLLCNLHLNSKQARTDKNCILFGKQLRKVTEFEIIKCLTKYISNWCSISIYYYPQQEQLKHSIYTFFEKVSILENLKPNIWPLWTVMQPNIFYNGLMSVNIYWLDRLAKLMLRHIKYDTSRAEEKADTPMILESSNLFHLYMADLYNALYLGMLFEKRKEGFIFNNLNEEEIKNELKAVNLNTCFQLEKHIALAPYYMNTENTIEDPLDLISEEAPNLHALLLTLNTNLVNDSDKESVIC